MKKRGTSYVYVYYFSFFVYSIQDISYSRRDTIFKTFTLIFL